MTAKERIVAEGYEDVLVFESPSYDEAFLGVSDSNRAVYDYDLMVECLAKSDGISEDEAREFIDFNTIRALPYMGVGAPIVLYRLRDQEEAD